MIRQQRAESEFGAPEEGGPYPDETLNAAHQTLAGLAKFRGRFATGAQA